MGSARGVIVCAKPFDSRTLVATWPEVGRGRRVREARRAHAGARGETERAGKPDDQAWLAKMRGERDDISGPAEEMGRGGLAACLRTALTNDKNVRMVGEALGAPVLTTAGLPAVACGEEAGVPPRAGAPLASETEFNAGRGGELAILTTPRATKATQRFSFSLF